MSDPRNVTVRYHHSADGWWGEIEGWKWSCAAPTLEQCRNLARDGIPYGVDERLRARSIFFLRVFENVSISCTPAASETFTLYVPEDVPEPETTAA